MILWEKVTRVENLKIKNLKSKAVLTLDFRFLCRFI